MARQVSSYHLKFEHPRTFDMSVAMAKYPREMVIMELWSYVLGLAAYAIQRWTWSIDNLTILAGRLEDMPLSILDIDNSYLLLLSMRRITEYAYTQIYGVCYVDFCWHSSRGRRVLWGFLVQIMNIVLYIYSVYTSKSWLFKHITMIYRTGICCTRDRRPATSSALASSRNLIISFKNNREKL